MRGVPTRTDAGEERTRVLGDFDLISEIKIMFGFHQKKKKCHMGDNSTSKKIADKINYFFIITWNQENKVQRGCVAYNIYLSGHVYILLFNLLICVLIYSIIYSNL